MTDIGHNSKDSGAVNASHLRSFIERIEKLEEEIRDLNAGKSEIYSEAKGSGFDAKIIRQIVAMRRVDREKRREEAEIRDLYMIALGMVE